MSLYSDLQNTATALLTAYGQSLTFTRETVGAYNPATLTATETSSTFSGVGVEVSYKMSEIDGQRVLMGDKKLIMEAMDTAPAVGDVVAVNATDYRVMAVMPKNPAGTVITYELQVRI